METRSLFFTISLHFLLFLGISSWNLGAARLFLDDGFAEVGEFSFVVDEAGVVTESDVVDNVAEGVALKKMPSDSVKSAESFKEAFYDDKSLNNSYPKYPALAKRRGEEGEVLLRVKVDEVGEAREVVLAKSSGSKLLDLAAVNAVERWKFVAAERFGYKVASVLLVPVVFKLY